VVPGSDGAKKDNFREKTQMKYLRNGLAWTTVIVVAAGVVFLSCLVRQSDIAEVNAQAAKFNKKGSYTVKSIIRKPTQTGTVEIFELARGFRCYRVVPRADPGPTVKEGDLVEVTLGLPDSDGSFPDNPDVEIKYLKIVPKQ
jgi:hypothetical protein